MTTTVPKETPASWARRVVCRLFGHDWDTHVWTHQVDPYTKTRKPTPIARKCGSCGLREGWNGGARTEGRR
jgi:hypothetical protein